MPVPTTDEYTMRSDPLYLGVLTDGRKFKTLKGLCDSLFSFRPEERIVFIKVISPDDRAYFALHKDVYLSYNYQRKALCRVPRNIGDALRGFIEDRHSKNPVNIIVSLSSGVQPLWACVDVKNELYALFGVKRA